MLPEVPDDTLFHSDTKHRASIVVSTWEAPRGPSFLLTRAGRQQAPGAPQLLCVESEPVDSLGHSAFQIEETKFL